LASEPQSQELQLGDLVGDYTDFFSQESVALAEGEVIELAGNSFLVLVRSSDVADAE